GRTSIGADVARDLADLLVWDVQSVVPAEADEQIVARDAGDGLRLEPEQPADSMILVHDVVAGTEIGERLQRAPYAGVGARSSLPEDMCGRQQRQAELAPDDPAARRR